MTGLLIALIVIGNPGGWQSYTNTNFISDMVGTDSVLYLATSGGVASLDILPEPALRRTFVNTDGLPTNRCLCISRDASGSLWVGTDGGGLAVIEPDSGRVRQYRPNDLAMRIRVLTWDGTRLLCGSDQGLYLVETRGTLLDFEDDSIVRFTTTRVPELLSDQILCVGSLDQYWVGTNRGVVAVDRSFQTWKPYREPFGDSVRAVAMWHDSLLIATEAGLAIGESAGFRPVVAFGEPTEVYELNVSGPRIYIATRAGLYEGDEADSTRFSVILNEDTRALHFADALWVGCGGNELYGSGLRYAFSGQSWNSYYNNCIWSASISDCAIDSTGGIYLCHYGGAVSLVDSTGAVSFLWSALPTPVQVRVDSRGLVWLAHFDGNGGLAAYSPYNGTWQKVQWGPSSSWNIIDAFGLDQHDTKWVFNGGAAVVAVDSAYQQTVFQVPGLGPPPGGLYEFAFDSRGQVWLGLNVGLVRIDYGGTLSDRSDDSDTILIGGLPSPPEVRSVAVDGRDNVWAATSQGVAVWNGASFQVFSTANSGILADNVYRVRVDASDRVWLLTESGLSVYDQVARSWTSFTPQNSGLIANTQGIVGFYSAMALSDNLGLGLIGTQRGLSTYSYSVPAESTTAHLRVYPNPCILGVHSGVVIDGLPYDATNVQVRTLSGRQVAELQVETARHQAVWRPRDQSSGLYLFVVSTPRGVCVGRVALVSR
jgi:ligand-binding sensor domain-containing protein